MPSPYNYINLFWVIALLLAGCGHTPARDPATPEAVMAVPDRHRSHAERLRNDVVGTARQLLGTPYRYGGTGPKGLDCSGLVWYSHRQVGIPVPRTAAQQYRSAPQRVGVSDLQAGDLLFFRIASRRVNHVGIYAGEGRFIHAPSSGGRVSMAQLDDDYWRRRLHGAAHYFH